jgi:hypothetical protein
VVQVAVRDAESVTAEQPLIVSPFAVKATVPVGFGDPLGATVAVKVTDWSTCEGFLLEVTAVVVPVPSTSCETEPLLLSQVLSPE